MKKTSPEEAREDKRSGLDVTDFLAMVVAAVDAGVRGRAHHKKDPKTDRLRVVSGLKTLMVERDGDNFVGRFSYDGRRVNAFYYTAQKVLKVEVVDARTTAYTVAGVHLVRRSSRPSDRDDVFSPVVFQSKAAARRAVHAPGGPM